MTESFSSPEGLELRERVKELRCLYRVAALSQRSDTSIDDYLSALPALLPAGWFYPEISQARVEYRGRGYQTENFTPTPWILCAAISVAGHPVGSLQLAYLQDMPMLHEGPFLAEERELLDALATHVSETLQRKELEERLRRARSLEALGCMAGGVAHDFNKLLSAIGTAAEQALGGQERGRPADEDLREILGVVERARRLANRLVGFANSSSDRPEPLCLNQTLLESRSLLARLLTERIELRLNLEPAPRPVKLDPSQFDQILANLALNAREAMPDGGVVEISTCNQPNDTILLSVKDSGRGMSEEIRARIFEPFFSTKSEGAGLGLATVDSIVRRAGGEISVHSAIDQGTTVELVFPCGIEPPAAPLPKEEVRATILLVEDEPALRYLCERLLKALGHRVLPAENGEQALAIAAVEAAGIDLMLCDLTLPDMDGGLLCQRIRDFHADRMAVVMMSGYSFESVVEAVDGHPFLQKPFNRESLRQMVSQTLAARLSGR